jgi:hypothetical protein
MPSGSRSEDPDETEGSRSEDPDGTEKISYLSTFQQKKNRTADAEAKRKTYSTNSFIINNQSTNLKGEP